MVGSIPDRAIEGQPAAQRPVDGFDFIFRAASRDSPFADARDLRRTIAGFGVLRVPRPVRPLALHPWYHESVFHTCRDRGRLMVLTMDARGSERRDHTVSDRVH